MVSVPTHGTPGENSALKQSVLAGFMAEAQARQRSRGRIAGMCAVVVGLLILTMWPPVARIFGAVDPTAAVAVVGTGFAVFLLACAAFHFSGPGSRAYRMLSAADGFTQYAVVLTLVQLSGTAFSILWAIIMARSFEWTPAPPRRVPLTVVQIITTHVVCTAVFLLRGHVADAAFTGLVLMACQAAQSIVSRAGASSLELRADHVLLQQQLEQTVVNDERDRVARELHDGIGADVTAILMELRRIAERTAEPGTDQARVRVLATRAQGILDGLRRMVWSLRNEQGTLGEVAKLLEVKCRNAFPNVTLERAIPMAQASQAVNSGMALSILRVADELLTALPTTTETVRLVLRADEALTLTAETAEGAAPVPGDNYGALRALLLTMDGTLTVSPADGTAPPSVEARIPLAA